MEKRVEVTQAIIFHDDIVFMGSNGIRSNHLFADFNHIIIIL